MTRAVIPAAVLAVVLTCAAGCGHEAANSNYHFRAEEGVHMVEVAVQSWAVDHHGHFPPPEVVNAEGVWVAEGVDGDWPTNPWSGEPMAQGTGAGDFTYTLGPDARSATIVLHGVDGEVLRTNALGRKQ